jgi:uncharacterized phage protein (TIGR02220 family)
MNRGYVKLYRKSLDAGWIKNHKLWAFWTYCLIKASYKEYDAVVGLQVIHLMPGQFIFGRKKAAEETGLTEREIRTIIDLLKKCENMTIKTTNKFSVITIINWAIYQGEAIENDQLNDQQATSKRPHTRSKEVNNLIYSQDALKVLSYLNEKTGRKYKVSKHIEARFKDGATVDDCRCVIDAKIADPYFIQNPKYLNPKTLFSPENFDKYQNEAIPLKIEASKSNLNSACPRCGHSIIVKADLTESGCVYCENKIGKVKAC